MSVKTSNPNHQAGAQPVSQPAVEKNTGTATSEPLLSPRVADLPPIAPPESDSSQVGPAVAGSVADLEWACSRLRLPKHQHATYRVDDKGALTIVSDLDHVELDPSDSLRLYRFLHQTRAVLEASGKEAGV